MENKKAKIQLRLIHRLGGAGHSQSNLPDRKLFVLKVTSDSDKLYWSYSKQEGSGKYDAKQDE